MARAAKAASAVSSDQKWRITLEPDDGSGAKYGLIVPATINPEDMTFVPETIANHEWVDPNVPVSFTVTVVVEGERGELHRQALTYDIPADNDGLENTLSLLCGSVSDVLTPFFVSAASTS